MNEKKKTKEGKKLKKKNLEEQEEQEDPDCEPPAPKKKKKKDKTADQVNGHLDEAADMNGNSNGIETPKKKKKSSEGDTEVSAALLVQINMNIYEMVHCPTSLGCSVNTVEDCW